MVKRVIGVPGDRIEVRAHRVRRNGIALTQASGSALSGADAGYRSYGEDSAVGYFVLIADDVDGAPGSNGPTAVADYTIDRVPDGEYFLLGDNRGHSRDSRETGTVPHDRILGRAKRVAFSRGGNGFREGRFLRRLR